MKLILDATCGSRMMWFDKKNPLTVFADMRKESFVLCDGRALEINPDIQMDFTDIPFPDESFYVVVLDPPHLHKLGKNTWMAQKYGVLFHTWQMDLKRGVEECLRVLKPNGVLIFKWNVVQITLNQVLDAIAPHKPLFGHTSGKHGKTIWMTFLKH